MEDVNISKYRASVVREGSKPASPGFVVSEGQSPTDPAGTGQNHLPVTIAAVSTGLSITESQILSGAGTVSQYIRGDGSLADFPEASGGGSSISYYLNGSINQGTIGGVAYKELSKVPILGAGTDFSISADGYIASFLTDAGDPNLLEIPGGNWNFETYFSSSSSGGTPTFYVELYKYDGTTFTLIASNSGSPEFIAFGTTLTAYFSTLAVPTTTLALTDRLAVRYYVTHSGRTITLHTEDNHLCQIVTTFTTGLTALNGLTAQVQNFAVGTSGTDFNIASATATHTFNLPTASATNRGALSSADWTTFNNKENAITAGTTAQYFRGDKTFQTLNTSVVPELTNLYYTEARVNANVNVAANTAARHNAVTLGTANGLSLSTQVLSLGLASAGVTGALSGTDWSTFNAKQNALGYTPVPETRTITINGTTQDLSANRTFNVGTVTSVGLSSATSGVTIGSTPVTTSGTITLAIATASGSQNGLLSSADWTTFNSKQNALTNPVTGTGTTNYLPKFTGASTIGNSIVQDNGIGYAIGVGVATSSWFLGALNAIQLQNGAMYGYSTSEVGITANAFYNASLGGWRYISNGVSTFYQQTGGSHSWHTAPSGTAGNAITWSTPMTLTSGGNLLVGTTTDNGARLQVSGTSTFSDIATFNNGTNSTNGIKVVSTLSSSLFTGGIEFIRTTVAGGSKIQPLRDAAIGGVGLSFLVTANNTAEVNATYTSALQILNTGAATFSSSVTATSFSLGSGNGVLSTSGFWGTQLRAGTGSFANFALLDSATNGIMYNPTGTLNMTFAGNVGIGTASTLAKLHTDSTSLDGIYLSSFQTTSGGADTGPVLYFGLNDGVNNRDAGQIKVLKENGTSGNYSTYMSFFTRPNGSSSSERMRITSGGNVGIGTTSPNSRLHIAGDFRTVLTSGVGGDTLIAAISGVSNGYIINVDTSNNITHTWNTGANAAALRITPSGNVGIGPTTITARLQVNGSTASPNNTFFVTTNSYTNLSSGSVLRLGHIGTSGDTIAIVQNLTAGGTGVGHISIPEGNLMVGSSTDNGSRLQINGAIRTAQPVGTTSNGWLLGRALVSGTSTPNRWIRVQIGLEYYDILAVYMGTL